MGCGASVPAGTPSDQKPMSKEERAETRRAEHRCSCTGHASTAAGDKRMSTAALRRMEHRCSCTGHESVAIPGSNAYPGMAKTEETISAEPANPPAAAKYIAPSEEEAANARDGDGSGGGDGGKAGTVGVAVRIESESGTVRAVISVKSMDR